MRVVSLGEIEKQRDERVRTSFRAKLQSYNMLKTAAPTSGGAAEFAATDKTENDRNDTIIVNEVVANRVDILITEDRGVHAKQRFWESLTGSSRLTTACAHRSRFSTSKGFSPWD
jgi:hypothetical protein